MKNTVINIINLNGLTFDGNGDDDTLFRNWV